MAESPAAGDRFDRWVSDHVETLYRVAFRLLGDPHDAEDVVQDAFRSAWTSRHLYDSARSERAWLLAILRRRAADHWRRSGTRVPPGSGELPHPVAPAGRDPFDDELSSAMQRALDRLPEELRETLLLVVVGVAASHAQLALVLQALLPCLAFLQPSARATLSRLAASSSPCCSATSMTLLIR
jgi:RNA polymerase sigma-70 factor (ECF subfamily)